MSLPERPCGVGSASASMPAVRLEFYQAVEESGLTERSLQAWIRTEVPVSSRTGAHPDLAFLDHAGSQLLSEASCEQLHGVARPRWFPYELAGLLLPVEPT